MDNTSEMAVFVRVVEAGNFSAAARELRARELRRLFIAAVAWTVDAVARWNTRHAQRGQSATAITSLRK